MAKSFKEIEKSIDVFEEMAKGYSSQYGMYAKECPSLNLQKIFLLHDIKELCEENDRLKKQLEGNQ